MKKHPKIIASIALTSGLVLALGGVAVAKGGGGHGNGSNHGHGHGGSGVVATGSPTCNFHGRVTVGANGAVSITGNITPKHGAACTSTGSARIRTGHFTSALVSATSSTTTTSSTTSTTTTSTTTTSSTTTSTVLTPTTTTTVATCTLLPVGSLPDLSGGAIAWSPRPKFAPSTGIALTGGSVSTVTVNGDQYLQIAYTGGSVAGGSFTNASGATLTVTSNQTVSELAAECGSGGQTITVHGTITL